MEARISSIDGSCAFAGWLIADFPATDSARSPHDGATRSRAANHCYPADIDTDRLAFGDFTDLRDAACG